MALTSSDIVAIWSHILNPSSKKTGRALLDIHIWTAEIVERLRNEGIGGAPGWRPPSEPEL